MKGVRVPIVDKRTALIGPVVAETLNVIWPLLPWDINASLPEYLGWISLLVSGLISIWAGWVCARRLHTSMFTAGLVGTAVWLWSVLCTVTADALVSKLRYPTAEVSDLGAGIVVMAGVLLIPTAFMFASFGAFLGDKAARA